MCPRAEHTYRGWAWGNTLLALGHTELISSQRATNTGSDPFSPAYNSQYKASIIPLKHIYFALTRDLAEAGYWQGHINSAAQTNTYAARQIPNYGRMAQVKKMCKQATAWNKSLYVAISVCMFQGLHNSDHVLAL